MGKRVAVCLAAVLCATGLSAPQGANPERIERLRAWLSAVSRHETGQQDDALFEVAAFSIGDVQTLMTDAETLVIVMRNPRAKAFFVKSGKKTQRIFYTEAQLSALRDLAKTYQQRETGDANRLIKRAAALEGDVAMLGGKSDAPFAGAAPLTAFRFRVPIADGQSLGINEEPMHWDLARKMLDLVQPDPAKDEMVKAWYRATMAYMQREQDHDSQLADRARELFPHDADIMFLNGALHETFAGPRIQNAMRLTNAPPGFNFDIGSAQSELRLAGNYLDRALIANPDFVEARLRLGRVMGLLGRHDRAAGELHTVVDTAVDDPLVSYHALMFLGVEEEALGHFAAARVAYERSLTWYPHAQSPQIALSHLAWLTRGKEAALAALRPVFDGENDALGPDDPWWTYHTMAGQRADEWLAALATLVPRREMP